MNPLRRIESMAQVLNRANIDTDQIIPARYLLGISRDGLGEGLFGGLREDGSFSRGESDVIDRRILVAGENFGCGSSREHAPWALLESGFTVVVATSFADIFRSNALKNGLLPLELTPTQQESLVSLLETSPDTNLVVDVIDRSLTFEDGSFVRFPIDEFARNCLINGMDELDYLLGFEGEIKQHESTYE